MATQVEKMNEKHKTEIKELKEEIQTSKMKL